MPTVSVIVPNYNHARYLRKRVDSILAQTYQDFELILLDDCSTDESREILKSYAGDARVRMEFNEQNSGSTFKQWNKGVGMARGKYVWIAESDDYAGPWLLERLALILDERPSVTFAYCRSHVVGEDDQPDGYADVYLDQLDAKHWKSDFVADGWEECRRVFLNHNPVANASAVLFRKELYEKAGGADEALRLCGDYKLWAGMALEGEIAYVAEPLNYYRTHSDSVRERTKLDGLGVAEFFFVTRWLLRRIVDPSKLPRELAANDASERVPAKLTPSERVRYCIQSVSDLGKWNQRQRSEVLQDPIWKRFREWQLALYEQEFALAPPGRWRYFIYKCKFYGCYFQTMSWKERAANLARLIGATVVGYRHRSEGERVYARVTEMLGAPRRRY